MDHPIDSPDALGGCVRSFLISSAGARCAAFLKVNEESRESTPTILTPCSSAASERAP
jgi:hypothetical protein